MQNPFKNMFNAEKTETKGQKALAILGKVGAGAAKVAGCAVIGYADILIAETRTPRVFVHTTTTQVRHREVKIELKPIHNRYTVRDFFQKFGGTLNYGDDLDGCFGVYVDWKLVGVACLVRDKGTTQWSLLVAVDDDHRRHGFGGKLVAATLGTDRAKGEEAILANIPRDGVVQHILDGLTHTEILTQTGRDHVLVAVQPIQGFRF